MVATLKAKSQLTIPASVVKQAGLKTGDTFDVRYQDGNIVLTPMVYVTLEEANEMRYAKEMDKRYEEMLDGNYVSHDSKSSSPFDSAYEEGTGDYIERVARAVRTSKKQLEQGKSYEGAGTLFEMLKERRPEVWA